MNAWILALIITLFFEGAMLGVAPNTWRRTMSELIKLPTSVIRRIGIIMSSLALLLLALLRWFN